MATLCFIIHGIGNQSADYSNTFQDALRKQIEKAARRHAKATKADDETARALAEVPEFAPIFWADLGGQEQQTLFKQIYPDEVRWRDLGPLRSTSFHLIGDIFSYLGKFQEQIKRRVFQKMLEVLAPRMGQKEPISVVIIGHSLGTVIVHDLLSQLIRYETPGFACLPGRMSVISMGSPIALFSLVGDNAPPSQFRKWINIRHPRDPIAFPLRPRFSAVEELRITFWWPPSLWFKPSQTHTLYWRHPRVLRRIAQELVAHNSDNIRGVCSQVPQAEPPLEVFQPGNRVAAEAGLIGYHPDYFGFTFGHLAGAKLIDVFFLYGTTWMGQNSQTLIDALKNKDTKIRVCLIGPASPAIPALCQSFENMPREKFLGKIAEATSTLIKAHETARAIQHDVGHLQIHFALNPPCHAFYRFDREMYVTPRKSGGGRFDLPKPSILVFRELNNGAGMFGWFMRDFDRTWNSAAESRVVFDSATSLNRVADEFKAAEPSP